MNAQPAESARVELGAARDLVCGENVELADGPLSDDCAGVIDSFHSPACRDRFNQDADIFTLGGPGASLATHDRGQRARSEHNACAGPVLFEVTSVGAGPG